ncbi:MAG: hypothetical protein ACI4IQ_04770 [Eubacterium sp.]
MTKSKRLLSIFLSLLMLISSLGATSVFYGAVADEEVAVPYYVNISSKSASISISGIKATCIATLKSKSSVALKIKMECQKEKSTGYETVETWTSSTTGTSLSMSESRAINLLYDYRLKVTFTAGSETVTSYAYPS